MKRVAFALVTAGLLTAVAFPWLRRAVNLRSSAVQTPRGDRVHIPSIWFESLPMPKVMPSPDADGSVSVNGVDLYYGEYGKGPPVLLLHGGLGNSDYFANQVPALAAHFRVIVVDTRGHGRSTRSDRPYSYELLADDVLGLMDKLQIGKASIVGWSDGGIVGLHIAIHHPERLAKLFAFGANYSPAGLRPEVDKNPAFRAYIERSAENYKRLSKTPNGFGDLTEAVGRMWRAEPNFTDGQLRSIALPVMIADGENDEAIKREHTEALAAHIPGARLLLLPGVTHFAMWQKPDEFNRSVLEFLKPG